MHQLAFPDIDLPDDRGIQRLHYQVGGFGNDLAGDSHHPIDGIEAHDRD
jgi:hypothetical protein